MKITTLAIAVAFTLFAMSAGKSSAQQTLPSVPSVAKPSNPVEIGNVNWGRDLKAAFSTSEQSGKPVFLLFQEVPGCAGCQKFGREVLSDPLLVEAIEENFHPVVVFNNRNSGSDFAILKKYKEPAWNYQVVRFVDYKGDDIVPRKDKVWTTGGIATRMVAALRQAQRPVPKYLLTIAARSRTDSTTLAAFAMSCFWTGEYRLGKIDGVLATEAGWLDGREVTLVRYDKNSVSLESLAQQAAKVQCAQKVYTSNGKPLAGLKGGKLTRDYRTASATDQKRQLSRWPALRQVPSINAMQLTKINSLAPDNRQQAIEWLSPKQRAALAKESR